MINCQIGDLDRVSIKIFRRGILMGNIAKFSERGNALGGISNRQNMVRIGQKMVQMLIKSEIKGFRGGLGQGRKKNLVRGV